MVDKRNIYNKITGIIEENSRCDYILNEDMFEVDQRFDDFVANPSDNWLKFLNDLISKYSKKILLDETSKIYLDNYKIPEETATVWEYRDDEKSILDPNISISNDITNIPNVVEIIYSNNGIFKTSVIENNDDNSPVSIKNRGRKIVERVINPDIEYNPSQERLDELAKNKLKELSSIRGEITYNHGYCPVRIGDCVRIIIHKLGLEAFNAIVVNQDIECKTGCSVSEKAIFNLNLWRSE